MGSVDYTNPRFEEYAPLFFDYTEVRRVLRLIEEEKKPTLQQVHINTKKFICALVQTVQKEA